MTIYGSRIPGMAGIARAATQTVVSPRAKWRLRILDWCRTHGDNIAKTHRRFGVSRRLIREWRDRLQKQGPVGLNDRSRRPQHFRKPQTPPEVVATVVRWRKQYPTWSKYKIRKKVVASGQKISASTVGRIFLRRGLIDPRHSQKRHLAATRPKARYPHGMKIARPGDMIQIDTKHIMLPGGKKWYQFTAIDVLTKQRVLAVLSSESSRNGAAFLDQCVQRFPFSLHAVQTDNGAPFQKEFVRRCAELKFPHYFIQPRHPKQNSYVESSHSADEREFYGQGNHWMALEVMRTKLATWERVWNTERPHQALNYQTPQEYLARWNKGRSPTNSIITLQT